MASKKTDIIRCPTCHYERECDLFGIAGGDRLACRKCGSGLVLNEADEIILPTDPTTYLSELNKTDKTKASFIIKHWRGDYSLPFSYWVISFCTNIILVITNFYTINFVENQIRFNPYILFSANLFLFVVYGIISLWHLVGTWRSASRYGQQRRLKGLPPGWGWAAKFFLFSGALNGAKSLGTLGSAVILSFSLSYRNDPSIENYKLTIIENGTELKIEGGLKYGIVNDVEQILSVAPEVRTINFESIGGRISVGMDLFNLISDRGLNTVTNTYCVSACTRAFAGGKNRWLGISGKLGYHGGAGELSSSSEIQTEERKSNSIISKRNGTSVKFLERGIQVSNSDMWYPTRDELLNEHVITSFAPKAESSITGIEKALMELADEEKKEITKNTNKPIEHVGIDVKRNLYVNVYDTSEEMYRVFQSKNTQIDQKKSVTEGFCADTSVRKDISLGVVYGFQYRSRATKATALYFEIGSCP